MMLEPRCRERDCKHYRGTVNDGDETTERVICAAFPDGILNKISYGKNLHLKPVEGDHGIRYEKTKDEEE